jgi:hypothetical protein
LVAARRRHCAIVTRRCHCTRLLLLLLVLLHLLLELLHSQIWLLLWLLLLLLLPLLLLYAILLLHPCILLLLARGLLHVVPGPFLHWRVPAERLLHATGRLLLLLLLHCSLLLLEHVLLHHVLLLLLLHAVQCAGIWYLHVVAAQQIILHRFKPLKLVQQLLLLSHYRAELVV